MTRANASVGRKLKYKVVDGSENVHLQAQDRTGSYLNIAPEGFWELHRGVETHIPVTSRIRRLMFHFGQSFEAVSITVRNEAYRRYIPPVLAVPDTSVSSVRRQHRCGNFDMFGTTSIPVP